MAGEPTPAPGDPNGTVVGAEVVVRTGTWWVELSVAFPDGVVTRLVGPYLDERKARVAAHFIARGAGSDRPPHPGL